MDRITEALGEGDEDVLNLKAGIDGLVFGDGLKMTLSRP